MNKKSKQLWVDPEFKRMVKMNAAKDNLTITEWTRKRVKANNTKEVSFDFKI